MYSFFQMHVFRRVVTTSVARLHIHTQKKLFSFWKLCKCRRVRNCERMKRGRFILLPTLVSNSILRATESVPFWLGRKCLVSDFFEERSLYRIPFNVHVRFGQFYHFPICLFFCIIFFCVMIFRFLFWINLFRIFSFRIACSACLFKPAECIQKERRKHHKIDSSNPKFKFKASKFLLFYFWLYLEWIIRHLFLIDNHLSARLEARQKENSSTSKSELSPVSHAKKFILFWLIQKVKTFVILTLPIGDSALVWTVHRK